MNSIESDPQYTTIACAKVGATFAMRALSQSDEHERAAQTCLRHHQTQLHVPRVVPAGNKKVWNASIFPIPPTSNRFQQPQRVSRHGLRLSLPAPSPLGRHSVSAQESAPEGLRSLFALLKMMAVCFKANYWSVKLDASSLHNCSPLGLFRL